MRCLTDRDPGWLDQVVEALALGGLVAFPTDTVYGLGCHAFLPVAIERLYAAKGRPRGKAIPILISGPDSLPLAAREVPPGAVALGRRFWPGGLTLVLRRAPELPTVLVGEGDTVAVRVPDHPIPVALVEGLGAPLAASSANLSGLPAPLGAGEVERQLGDRIDLLLTGGPAPRGAPSSVVDLAGARPALLREGAIKREAIEEILGTRLEVRL